MSVRRKTRKALAMLLPTGVLGISSALASVHSEPPKPRRPDSPDLTPAVGDRLRQIRSEISEMNALAERQGKKDEAAPIDVAWLNAGFGWRNGGWGNGGWHNWGNGGWHNWGNGGWHNGGGWGNGGGGWGNGGWPNGWHNAPNWGNGGWNNGWHNFWHNW